MLAVISSLPVGAHGVTEETVLECFVNLFGIQFRFECLVHQSIGNICDQLLKHLRWRAQVAKLEKHVDNEPLPVQLLKERQNMRLTLQLSQLTVFNCFSYLLVRSGAEFLPW